MLHCHYNSMEISCRRKNSSSGDKFSFPVIVQDSDEFEFGSITSPASPADHLFSNGKLLPHAFPIQTPNNFSYSRSTSRTSSISSSSRDSSMWSRSNSTNSRSSTCSSARTSTSEATSERRLMPGGAAVGRRSEKIVRSPVFSCHKYQYESSRRWQLIAAVPVLKHQGSSSRKADRSVDGGRRGLEKSRGGGEESKGWFGRKILKSLVSTCKECHAIKT